MSSALVALQSCHSLRLYSIAEPIANQLRLIVLETVIGDHLTEAELNAEPDPALRSILAGSRRIDHFPGCRRFEVFWESYIGYSVVNESFANGEPATSARVGKMLVEFTASQYLEYIAKASFATEKYPGPYKHWAIYTSDHIVDVASQVDPVVSQVMTSDKTLERTREE